MKTHLIQFGFIVALLFAVLAVSPVHARADGWSSYQSSDTDYSNYTSRQNDKGFESGFAINGGRVMTQEEIDEAKSHIGPQYPLETTSYGATAHVDIPLD